MANDNEGDKIAEADLEKDLTPTAVEDPANLTPEKVAELVKERDTLAAQKKHWRDKAIDPSTGKPYRDIVAEANKRVDPINPQPVKPLDGAIEKRVASIELVNEKRDFGYRNNLSPEAVDNVYAHAQGRGMKPEEALKDPFVKSGLEALKAQERVRNAVPGPSHRAASVGGKSFGEMKPEERRANWGKVTGARS